MVVSLQKIFLLICLIFSVVSSTQASAVDCKERLWQIAQEVNRTGLSIAESAWSDPSHADHSWVRSVAPRILGMSNSNGAVGQSKLGSATVIRQDRSDPSQTTTFISARHTINSNSMGLGPVRNSPDSAVGQTAVDAKRTIIVETADERLYKTSNTARAGILFAPQISEGELQNSETTELKNDFYVGTSPRNEAWYRSAIVGPEVKDEQGLTQRETWFKDPVPDGKVITLGYPLKSYKMQYSIGRVVPHDEAKMFLEFLTPYMPYPMEPYQPKVEFLVEAAALPGMSGGGVFDGDGYYLGSLAQGVRLETDMFFIRIVKAGYIADQLKLNSPETLRILNTVTP